MTKVLIISRECWRSDSNEGNVLTSLFSGQSFEFANIYCKPGLPDNPVCNRYFQLTDRMALDHLLRRTPVGRTVEAPQGDLSCVKGAETENKAFYDFFRRHNLELFYSAREFLWLLSGFESSALDRFVLDFQPDVIFAPLCYSKYVLRLQRYVIGLAACPAVTYIYDDLYSLRQFRLSPIFWLNRLGLRREIKKTLPFYRFAYTMSDEQAEEYRRLLHTEMRVLRKAAENIAPCPNPFTPGTPVRFIYAGGIYYGRDKLLMALSAALRIHGPDKCRLDVYTNSPLSKKAAAALNDGRVSFLHQAVPQALLTEQYRFSQVSVHVESFRLKYKLLTRLSFSTKIVDCLSSGCAVLAICPEINAGFRYLKHSGGAVCIARPADIPGAVDRLLSSPALLGDYASRALSCAEKNHGPAATKALIGADLKALL